MWYSKSENKYVVEGTAFTLNGIQYPAVWLNTSSAQEKSDAGLVEVTVKNDPADDRFYWVSQDLKEATLTYVNTPKDLDQLKDTWKSQVNNQVYTQLQPSDYMPARAFETGEPMDTAWKTYRSDVRTYAVTIKANIDNAKTVEELATVVTNMQWPNDPNYVVSSAE